MLKDRSVPVDAVEIKGGLMVVQLGVERVNMAKDFSFFKRSDGKAAYFSRNQEDVTLWLVLVRAALFHLLENSAVCY